MGNNMDEMTGRLLVTDSSIHSTDLISHWLGQENLDADTAESGLNAFAKARLFMYDVVITNTELPDISGFDLCKMLKGDESARYTMVLIMNNNESDFERARAMEVGADDYIELSAGHYQFIARVRQLLRVKQLSNQLRRQYSELEEKNRIIDRHLQMGQKVQRALIPDIDTRYMGCSVLSAYYPALGVGGDFYTIIPLSDASFGIVMGDVSGHGIASSFLTVTLNLMCKNNALLHAGPGDLLYALNNDMCALFDRDEFELYACVFYAVVDTKSRTVSFANAGLTLPLVAARDAGDVRELETVGVPLGFMRDMRYEQKSISYKPGDMLLLYTDGLQDTYYKDQPDAFLREIKDIFSELCGNEDMHAIMGDLCRHFYRPEASASERIEMDDVSLLLCRL
jgi:sigma-B regulation protein RsbU (phosphoserine phosphatase)